MAEELRRGVDGEMVSDDSLHSTSTPWIGAFERVMGDQGSNQYQKRARPRSRILSRTPSVTLGESEDVVPLSRSAAASPFKVSDGEETVGRHRLRSGSLGTASVDMKLPIRPNPAPRSLSTHYAARRKANVTSGPPLVSVSQVEGGMVVEDLYLNHAPSLYPLHIRNVSEGKRILLRLGSDLGRGLTFMKRKRQGQDPKEAITYPTNTVKWAKESGLHPSKLRDIRHLLANLESSDSLILEAGAEEDIFVSFRPGESEPSRLQVPPRSPTPSSERQQTLSHDESFSPRNSSSSSMEVSLSPRSAPELTHATTTLPPSDLLPTFASADTSGLISLRASMLSTTEASTVDEAGGSEPIISSSASNMSSSSSRPPSFYSSTVSSTTSAPTTDGIDSRADVQLIELPFYARYCRPQLAASKYLHRGRVQSGGLITLDAGDIFVGQNLEMEVYLHNQSQIDMFWQARLDDADNMLQSPPVTLVDDDGTIEAVTSADDHPFKPNLLAQGEIKRVKVALHPAEPCRDYEQVITFTNMHNAGNSIRVLVRANMLGKARDDALSLLSGDVVDFGDCAGGHWTRQLLVLRNNCEQFLDVQFNIEKGIEANFQLAELAQRSNEDQLVQQEAPMLHSLHPVTLGGTSESGESEREQQSVSSVANPSSPSSSSGFFLSTSQLANAQELARTPMANPQSGAPIGEPPFYALPGQDRKKKDRGGEEDDEDDVDASSVASQAGSLPGSPTKAGPGQPDKSLVLEPPIPSDGAPFSDVASSEGEREGSSRSKPASDIYSSRPSSRGLLSHFRGESDRHGEEGGSVRSDVTAVSHDSRLGPFLASSLHAADSSSSQGDRSKTARHGGAVALSGLRSVEQAHGNQLEELILRPGAEYRVIVSYRPPKGQGDADFTQGKLMERTFRLLLDYAQSKSSGVRSRGGRERKTVLCRIRTCTSFISVSPKMIDFGLANVGTKKSTNFIVTNHSELTARIDLRFVSKVLSMYRDEISIPPLQSLELRVDFFPRRVNDNYRKQVTVANLLNRANDEIVEVRSKNIDEQKVSFHSLFYRILTSTGSNFIDFGDVNINCTRLRSFSIENISKGRLTLELSAAHAEDLKLYVKAGDGAVKTVAGANKYAELEAADAGPPVVDNDTGRGKSGRGTRAMGIDLKERFLETMSQESPASIRKENASWRIAQKDSHYRKGKGGHKRGEQGEKQEPTKKAPINLMSALKKGGKGRLTVKYGRGIAFKDNKLLCDFEYLDLASGPPIDGKRIPTKSKKYQMLDGLEIGKTQAGSKGHKSATDTKRRPSVGQQACLAARDLPKKETSRPPTGSSTRSPALTGKRKAEPTLHDAAGVSHLSVDELVSAVESQSSSLSTFFLGNPLAEEQSVRTEINLQRELQNAIATGRLEPIEMLSIAPGEERQVIAVYTPNGSTRPHIQGNARKQDSRIFLRLVEFQTAGVDHIEDFSQMLRLGHDELPVRELMVKSNICRSILELSQPHINFGQMNKGDVKMRKILIQNRSEWALRFCIRKSGNISSGDIRFKSSDRYGVVPGYGKREVEFVFCPTLTGAFQEKLTVENVADRDKDETVFLKANVRKVSKFKVEPNIVEFDNEDNDALPMGKVSSKGQSFVVSNVSTKRRTFVFDIDAEELQFQTFKVDVLLSSSSDGSVRPVLSKAEEEEVEHISQKLKIANRKGQAEKIKKYQDRLSELGIASQGTSPVLSKEDLSNLDDDGSAQTQGSAEGQTQKQLPQLLLHQLAEVTDSADESPSIEEDEASKLKQVSSTVTLTLAPGQTKKLLLRLRPLPTVHGSWQHDSGEFSINVRVHEVKNTDEVQRVEIRGRAQGSLQSNEVQPLPNEEGWVVFSAPSATQP